jgi:hypothetical protein
MTDDVIGRADLEIDGDATPLKQELDQVERDLKSRGDRAERDAESRANRIMGKLSTIGKAGLTAIGAAGVALGGALVQQFGQLEQATANFRRETGATAEEAREATKAINAMAGDNLQPIAEIGDALAKVHTDLGLTGDAAAAAAQDFLDFGRATGQDAGAAVLAFDDILDAWGLEASEATKIMDALVLSHQKYGGSIQDNQALLNQLAPALKAANMSWEDGLGILNLFARAGVGAEAAATGLNRALSKVSSPEELQQLLSDISATEDDFTRAQKAAELFGNRAGPKLANALADANGDLTQFKVNMDDAEGATDRAADASMTMADQVKLAFRGVVSDAAALFGPDSEILTAIGSLGLLLAPALKGAFLVAKAALTPVMAAIGAALGVTMAGSEGIGSAAVQGAMVNAGTASGRAFGIAWQAAALAGIAGALMLGYNELQRVATESFRGSLERDSKEWVIALDRSTQIAMNNLAMQMGISLDFITQQLRQKMLANPGLVPKEAWAQVEADIRANGLNAGQAGAEGIAQGLSSFGQGVPGIDPAQSASWGEAWAENFLDRVAAASWKETGETVSRELVSGVTEGIGSASLGGRGTGGSDGTWVLEIAGLSPEALARNRATAQQSLVTWAEQVAQMFGTVVPDMLGVGVKDMRKQLRTEFDQVLDDMQTLLTNPGFWNRLTRQMRRTYDRLQDSLATAQRNGDHRRVAILTATMDRIDQMHVRATGRSLKHGRAEGEALGRGLDEKQDRVRNAAGRLTDKIEDQFSMAAMLKRMKDYGSDTAQAYIDGVNAKRQAAIEAGAGLVKALGTVPATSSPPRHPDNPWRNADKWGADTVNHYLNGMRKAAASARIGSLIPVPGLGSLSGASGSSRSTVGGTIRLVVVDESGGLSKAGISTGGLADALSPFLQALERSAGMGYS